MEQEQEQQEQQEDDHGASWASVVEEQQIAVGD
jgi:hypothetical protein